MDDTFGTHTPPTVASLRSKWNEMFQGDLKAVRAAGISGQIAQSPFRSVCWRMFLGVLPDENTRSWVSITKQAREQYDQLRKRYVLDLRDKMKSEANLTLNNPLSQDEDSPWKRFFEDIELQKTIQQDVERTYPDQQFFRSERVQTMLADILFIFSRENDSISYRQGMHELLALILWVVDNDKVDPASANEEYSSEPETLIKILLHPSYVEHDAFVIFNALMQTVLPWFDTGSLKSSQPMTSSSDMLDGAMLFGKPVDTNAQSTAVIRKCYRIHHQLLKQYDPKLYDHLQGLGIEPQLYGIRWTRLLFGREFHIVDVLRLWDGIFADDKNLDIVDYMCVSMLIYLREQLLQVDYTAAMSRLMKYPPVEDVMWLLERAIQIRDAPFEKKPIPANTLQSSRSLPIKQAKSIPPQYGRQTMSSSFTPSAPVVPKIAFANSSKLPSLVPFSAPSKPTHFQQRSATQSPPIYAPAPSPIDPLSENSSSRVKELEEELATLKNINTQMSTHINKGMMVLSKELLGATESHPANIDTVNLVLAAMKQVRDILAGDLPYTAQVFKANETAFDAALNESADVHIFKSEEEGQELSTTTAHGIVDNAKEEKETEEGQLDGLVSPPVTTSSTSTENPSPYSGQLDTPHSSPAWDPSALSASAVSKSFVTPSAASTTFIPSMNAVNTVSPPPTTTTVKKPVDLFADVEDEDAELFFDQKHKASKPTVRTSGLENLLE